MATFPGSYVPINQHSNARVNAIIDNLLTPELMCFRQIPIYDETGTITSTGGTTWRLSYPNWNVAFNEMVYLNSQLVTPASVDHILGTVTLGAASNDGDNVNVTYNFDWFPAPKLAGFIYRVVDVINNSGEATSSTNYTINDAPANWDGVIADLTIALCMEHLLLCQNLWLGKLIFAIPNVMEDGGDITGSLETIKSNAEERANISLNNTKFKVPNSLAPPTGIYYAAVRGIGRTYTTSHGLRGGKLRGWQSNRYI